MRKGFLSIEWQDIDQHGLLIASVLAFTRYRHRFDPEWAPSRRVIMKEFKLGRVVAQEAVDKVCEILGIAHKRTPKSKGTGTKPNHIGNTETHHIDERNRTTCGTETHHIDDETAPPSIYNFNRTIIERPYQQWNTNQGMLDRMYSYMDKGEWFWLMTTKDEQSYLWDSYNMPPIDTDHELTVLFKIQCGYTYDNNMIVTIGDLTPQHFIDAHYNPPPFIGAAR